MKKWIAFFVAFFFSLGLTAQNILLEKETEDLYKVSEHGPNRKHYFYMYGGMGFYTALPSNVKAFNTKEWVIGIRYKRKVNPVFSMGTGLMYKMENFRFDDYSGVFEENISYQKEKLTLSGLGSELYMRINFDEQRGNYLGHFVDAGMYGEWIAGNAYKTYENEGFGLFAKKKTVYKDLSFIEDFSYGVLLRMARNQWAIYIHYRLSDYADERIDALPRAVIGIQLGFHK